METSDFDFENLFSIFEDFILNNAQKEKNYEILVAYSGGIDSTALLYLANKFAQKEKIGLNAVHVNHNINIDSKKWENHCKFFCKKINVPLFLKNINIDLNSRDSIEEVARNKRYEAIHSIMKKNTCLLTAHHADDQVETFFYNLFRGSGVKGLSSMPEIRFTPKGLHLRPFLGFNKNTLEDFVTRFNLEFINDKSNENTDFARNYIRSEVLPVVKKKWPNYSKTIQRAIANISNAQKLNLELALADFQKFKIDGNNNRMNIKARSLEENRFNNVIRFWIGQNNFKMPTLEQINSIKKDVFGAGKDKKPYFSCGTYEIHRFKDIVEIMSPLKKHDPTVIYKWRKDEDLIIPSLSVKLRWQNLEQRLGREIKDNVEVRFRHKGQNIKVNSTKSLKDYMREKNIPPWERDRAILIFINDEFKIVWDV